MAKSFLPDDKLPECWNDEARINVLFAPFRDKSVNPKDWETKLAFWKNVIHSYCVHNRTYTFTYEELVKKFARNGRSPVCLDVVIEHMYKANEIKPLQNFLQKPSETWSGWAAEVFVKKPLIWSYTKIKDSIISPGVNISYVHIDAVELESQKILNDIPADMKNKIIDGTSIAKSLDFNDMDQLNILLHYLYCKGKLSIKILQNKGKAITLLKFHGTDNLNGISDKDIDIYTLKQSEETLLDDIEKLEKQTVNLIDTAKMYLSKNQRQSAKSCLRKKREIEKTLEKRANTLHNIQTLLSRIEDANSDAQVLDSYKKALTNLRTTFSETGLTEESVSNTMLELEEVLEIHDGIQATLAQQDTTVDSDIEKELADILAADSVKESVDGQKDYTSMEEVEAKLSELDINLPSPPKSDINKTKISL